MLKKAHHKTIVISDLHLGTENSKAKEVLGFLKTNTCDTCGTYGTCLPCSICGDFSAFITFCQQTAKIQTGSIK